MPTRFRKTLSFAATAVMLAGAVGSASAATTWQKNHPRRTQANHRLNNQNGGHLTKPGQRVLDR